ncbi:hypothetical protein AN218_09070 [Streptomyces nanshensis]|uniref:TIR domain-containing protein n=1 Tax=Streptomyces nanshensis TaxID=518642 RepID=A0A1E7L7Z5_9ACTN|nr:hypothetical protein AN218_09070 [Streptomyces nanshensis]
MVAGELFAARRRLARLSSSGTAVWLAACLACWAVFLPLLGPWLALTGLLIPFTVFFPSPSFAALWRMRQTRVVHAWTWRRLGDVQALALPVTLLAVGCGVLVAMPSGGPLFWAVLVLTPLGILAAAATAAVEIRPESAPEGSEPTPTPTPVRDAAGSSSSLVAKALFIAGVFGVYAWALGDRVREVVAGERQPAPRVGSLVRWIDAQIASSVFGPTYDRQWYWAFLVGAAALLAGGCSLLLRDALLRAGTAADPFGAASGPYEAPSEPTSKVFLSYSRKDTASARRLSAGLEERLGELWVDWQAINPSEEWRESIARAVRGADAFVVLLSRDALTSTHCWDECRQAIELRKRILPVVIDPELERGSTSALMRERGWGELTAFQKLSLAEPDEEQLAQGIEDILAFVHQHHRWVAFHSRLGVLAHQWWESGRVDGLLLRADELSVAEAWERHAPDERDFHAGLTEKQRRYLDASRRAVRRRTMRVRSLLAAGTAVVVALSGLVAAGQAGAEHQYRTALSRKLAALAGDVARTDPEKSLQYALAARGQADTAEARNAIAERLDAYNAVRTVVAPRGRSPVEEVVLSRKGDVLLIDRGRSTEVWDVRRARSRGVLEGGLLYSGGGGTLSLSADGRTMAVLANDRSRIDLADTRTLRVKDSFAASETGGPTGRFMGGALSSDGRRLLGNAYPSSGNEPGDVVWDVRDHRIAGTFGRGANLAPSGRTLLREDDGALRFRSLEGSDAEQDGDSDELDVDTDSSGFVAFTARDEALINVDGETRLYAPGDAKPRVPVPGKAVANRLDAGGGPAVLQGRYAVFAEAGEKPYELWDLQERRRVASASTVEKAIEEGRGEEAPEFDPADSRAEAQTPDGSLHATAAADGSVMLWERGRSGRISRHLPVPEHDGGYAISPDARTVASATENTVSTWDTGRGRRTGTFRLTGVKGALAFDRHGSLLAVAVGHPEDDGFLKLHVDVIRVRDGHRVARFDAGGPSKNHVADLIFSPDGKKLYAALTGDAKVVAWDPADPGRRPRTVARTDGFADHAALSRDGTKLAAAGRQGTVGVYDTSSGALLRTVREASDMAFSPDGRRLATTYYSSRSVSVRDLRSGKKTGGDLVPEAGASHVQFSPDGRRLAVVGDPDGGLAGRLPVTLWDLSSRRPVGPRIASVHAWGAVRIAPDGEKVVTAGRYGTSVVDTTPQGRVRSLCGMVTHRVSAADWQDVARGERFHWPC